MHKDFAYWYSLPCPGFTSETLTARWQAIEKFGAGIKTTDAVEMIRLFYGRPGTVSLQERFRDVIKEIDTTYLMTNDSAELAVLTGTTIVNMLSKGDTPLAITLAMGIACMDFAGARRAEALPPVITEARRYLAEVSIRRRKRQISNVPISTADLEQALGELKKQTDPPAIATATADLIKLLSSRTQKLSEGLSTAINDVVSRHREESDMLWWLFSEHTSEDNCRFPETDLAAACYSFAKDLASLTTVLPGPLSAEAFLKKALSVGRPDGLPSVCIGNAVDNSEFERRKTWASSVNAAQTCADLCPCTFALLKSVEAGNTGEWRSAFGNTTSLNPDAPMDPAVLCNQIYQEQLFLRALEVKA